MTTDQCETLSPTLRTPWVTWDNDISCGLEDWTGLAQDAPVLSKGLARYTCNVNNYMTYSQTICEPFFPLQHSKTPRTPNLSKICPDDCFSGFPSGGRKFVQNLSKIWKFVWKLSFFKFLTNFGQIWVPLIITRKNNRRDKFLTNLGFRAFLSAVRGKRVRNKQFKT